MLSCKLESLTIHAEICQFAVAAKDGQLTTGVHIGALVFSETMPIDCTEGDKTTYVPDDRIPFPSRSANSSMHTGWPIA